MPIEVIIPVPIQEFNHYKELHESKMWDIDFELWTVLKKYTIPIKDDYEVWLVMFNTPEGVVTEYELCKTSPINKEIDSSEMQLSFSTWSFRLHGEIYNVSVRPTKN